MNMKALFLLLATASCTIAMDNLDVAYEWKQLDFDYPSEEARNRDIDHRFFIPEHNLPLGLEVFGDRLFITVPRWKPGIAASLTYINLSEKKDSPKLKPYPNWDAHNFTDGNPEVISPFRIRADQCGRLWVLDTGIVDILFNTGPKSLAPTRLLIYDLTKDKLIRKYDLPKDQVKSDSFFANIAVEDHDCLNTFAYLGDLGKPAVVVYSYKNDESWRVQHNYFHVDPLAGEFNVSGEIFEWTDGVFGMALSKPDPEGYSTLFFHPLSSMNEFSVSTKYLREKSLIKTSYHAYRLLGSRGPKGQSSVSFLDKKTDVLFYSLVNLNAVACWRTTNPNYTMESQGRVYMSNVTMVFPNDIKVDAKDTLWVLSDKLPKFMYSQLDPDEVNFRILNASVPDAIRGTACDSKLVVSTDGVRRFTTPGSSKVPGATAQPSSSNLAVLNLFVVAFVAISHVLS